MKIKGKILRVMSEDDGKTQTTLIAIGAPEGAPPFPGAVSAGGPGIPNAFAVLELTDPADISRFEGGTAIWLTLDQA